MTSIYADICNPKLVQTLKPGILHVVLIKLCEFNLNYFIR